MKLSLFKQIILGVSIGLIMPNLANAKEHQPEALHNVLERTESLTANGRQAVVVFDLDDTLINTRERNLRIIMDFIKQPEIQTAYSEEVAKISQVQLSQIKYLMTDTLKGLGVANEDLIKIANDFWLTKFFTNEYCALDKQNRGATQYLHELVKAGAKIVYLTGRDVPRMQEGTFANLKRNFLPRTEPHATLMMKPDPKLDDLQFKKDAFSKISEMGVVVGVFENEPANINAMADAFPNATAIFLNTIHSPKTDVPQERILWVKDFMQPKMNANLLSLYVKDSSIESLTIAHVITVKQAQRLACKEAKRVDFHFETTCDDNFDKNKPDKITKTSYMFFGQDDSGDCGIEVFINKTTGRATSSVSCN